jgi:hypothetical protein
VRVFNDQAHGRAIARPVERLVVPDSEPQEAPKKKLKKLSRGVDNVTSYDIVVP